MRILIAHEAAVGAGGVESYLAALIPGLRARGHAVAFLHHRSRAEVGPTRLVFDDVPDFSVEDEGIERSLADVAAWKPDVCFSHNMGPLDVDEALMARWRVVKMMHGYFGTCISSHKAHAFPSVVPCTRVFGAPCVALYVPRRCGPLRPGKAIDSFQWNVRQSRLLDRYAAIVVASGYMQQEYVRHRVPRERITVAPLFATAEPSTVPRTAPAQATVLFAGRMTALKGPAVLLEATAIASRLMDSSPIRLVMAGDGPDRDALVARAQALGIDASFPGWLTGAARTKALRSATVIGIPSLWPEPFGLVGFEGAVHGVPSIAFDSGGIAEWLTDGVNGRLVRERGSAEALGRALAATLGDQDLLHRLEHGALATVARMTLDRHVSTLESVFASVQ